MYNVIQKNIYEQYEIETSITEKSPFEKIKQFAHVYIDNEQGIKEEYVYLETTYDKVGGATMYVAKIKLYKV